MMGHVRVNENANPNLKVPSMLRGVHVTVIFFKSLLSSFTRAKDTDGLNVSPMCPVKI